jgi:hypothetical protein
MLADSVERIRRGPISRLTFAHLGLGRKPSG